MGLSWGWRHWEALVWGSLSALLEPVLTGAIFRTPVSPASSGGTTPPPCATGTTCLPQRGQPNPQPPTGCSYGTPRHSGKMPTAHTEDAPGAPGSETIGEIVFGRLPCPGHGANSRLTYPQSLPGKDLFSCPGASPSGAGFKFPTTEAPLGNLGREPSY